MGSKLKLEATLTVNYSLDIKCPSCAHEFDLSDDEDDGVYTTPIFNNKWDELEGEGVECPKCDCMFTIYSVEC